MKINRLACLFAALSLLGMEGIANAQAATRVTACDSVTPNNALCVEVTPPAANADGTPVTLPLIYRVEQKFGTGSFATVATALTTPRYYAKNLAPGDYLFRIYANCVGQTGVVNCSEGAASNTTGKSIAVPTVTPNAPVIIIAATIRAGQPPTFRVVYTVRPRDGEYVFVAPESMRSAFAAR